MAKTQNEQNEKESTFVRISIDSVVYRKSFSDCSLPNIFIFLYEISCDKNSLHYYYFEIQVDLLVSMPMKIRS